MKNILKILNDSFERRREQIKTDLKASEDALYKGAEIDAQFPSVIISYSTRPLIEDGIGPLKPKFLQDDEKGWSRF